MYLNLCVLLFLCGSKKIQNNPIFVFEVNKDAFCAITLPVKFTDVIKSTWLLVLLVHTLSLMSMSCFIVGLFFQIKLKRDRLFSFNSTLSF